VWCAGHRRGREAYSGGVVVVVVPQADRSADGGWRLPAGTHGARRTQPRAGRRVRHVKRNFGGAHVELARRILSCPPLRPRQEPRLRRPPSLTLRSGFGRSRHILGRLHAHAPPANTMPHATLPPPGFQAVILCGPGASLSTFTSSPKDIPKALLPIANRPMLWYPLEWCYRMGVTG
jgi:hypothetical protein